MAEDDDSGGYFTSLVSFNFQSNITYQIVVAGYQGATGNVVLQLSPGTNAGLPGPTNGYILTDELEPVITQQPGQPDCPGRRHRHPQRNGHQRHHLSVVFRQRPCGRHQWHQFHFGHHQFLGQRGGQLLCNGGQCGWLGAKRHRSRRNRRAKYKRHAEQH